GGRGALGAFVLNPGTPSERKLPAAGADVKLPRDSVLRICTPSGGGYGDAGERGTAAIERDLREERIGRHAAGKVHGEGVES
ncbi:MAG: hydantoinase B/oxoprolinase family protein, partial [Burkholderiales bacterium]